MRREGEEENDPQVSGLNNWASTGARRWGTLVWGNISRSVLDVFEVFKHLEIIVRSGRQVGSGGSGLKVEREHVQPRLGRRGFSRPLVEALGTGPDGCPLKVPAKVPRRAGLWWLSRCFHNSPGSFGSCLWLCWLNRCSGAASCQGPGLDQMSAWYRLWVLGARWGR